MPPLERLKDKADFEAALARGSGSVLAKSPHFVVHYSAVFASSRSKLSTGGDSNGALPVEDFQPDASSLLPQAVRVGAVLPKRLARRAVTRNLLKRQIHAAAARALPQLCGGAWVLRLRAPIDKAQFPSAASDALRQVVREELDALLVQAARRLQTRGATSRARAGVDAREVAREASGPGGPLAR